jgi:hypothetical protein
MLIIAYRLFKNGYYKNSFIFMMEYLLTIIDRLFVFIEEPFYKNVKIKNPIFIIGLPRSSTTGLHETLVKSTSNTNSNTHGKNIFNSNIMNYLFSNLFLVRFIFISELNKYNTPNHIISENILMEEEMVLFKFMMIFKYPHIFKCFSYKEISNLLRFDENDLIYIKKIMQRRNYNSDKQFIGKILFSYYNAEILKKHFNDCVVIYCKRDPHDSLNSFFYHLYNIHSKNISNLKIDEFSKIMDFFFNYYKNFSYINIGADYTIEFSEWCNNNEYIIKDICNKYSLQFNNFSLYRETHKNNTVFPIEFENYKKELMYRFRETE